MSRAMLAEAQLERIAAEKKQNMRICSDDD
jgi:hypothetical protein